MNITEGHSNSPTAKPRWHSLYSWILFVLGVGTICLIYRTAGSVALFAVLLFGSLVGAGFVVVTHRWLQWCNLFVFGGVMIGSIAAVELTVRDGSVPVNWLHDSGVPTLNSDGDAPFFTLAQRATLGAFVGGIVGVVLGGWLRARFGSHVEESARRWYLPSKGALAGLLGLLLLFGSCLIWNERANREYNERAKAAEAIEKMGGRVSYASKGDDGYIYAVKFQSPQVTDAGLECLKGLNQLRELDLRHTQVAGAGLEYIIANDQLQELKFDGTPVTDAGLEHLKGLKNLQTLSLRDTQVTDAGLAHLKGLTRLRVLSLSGTAITDAGLEHLTGLTQLQELQLDGTKVTDAGLRHLRGLNELEFLVLVNTQVTDAGLEHLKAIKQLRGLFLGNSKSTNDGVKKLQHALPNCEITR